MSRSAVGWVSRPTGSGLVTVESLREVDVRQAVKFLLTLVAVLAAWMTTARAAEQAVVIPAPQFDNPKVAGSLQTAVLAGGCFWGVQGVYQHVVGVRKALSGYAGGVAATAEYRAVSSGTTGHAESVQIVFDPKEISYGEILQIFFSVVHDPTQLNRQGPDTGTQYRSNIFYADAQQKLIAERYIAQLNQAKVFRARIATRVDAWEGFYPAEAYHQDYLIRNPNAPYIAWNDMPKIRNFERLFPSRYRSQPIRASATP